MRAPGAPRPRSRRRAAVLGVIGLLAVLAGPSRAVAAEPVTFGEPAASSRFGEFVSFEQPVTLGALPRRIELLLATPGAVGPTVIPLPDEAARGASVLDYQLDLTGGHIVPNTRLTAQWRVVDEAGGIHLGPILRHVYTDDRVEWKTLSGDVVNVHWVDGDERFGQRALKIGADAVAETAALLGVTETEPIDFFIYGDEATFRGALGPATRENVGGQAHPEIRTLFALITPGDIDASWVESVVPHELTHLVFATAVDNAYHDPPHWLNEGLAVYLADGYDADNKAQVAAAVRSGSIIPLDGLAGAFPTTRDRFFLAYAESVSAVDRIVRVNGRDALIRLVRSYADGVSDDDAFRAALGQDVAGFEADWLAELGARRPVRRGPQVAPAGPLPDGWSGPLPDPSFEVTGSLPPATPGAPIPGGRPDDPLARFLMPSLSLVGVALVLVVVAVTVRRARRRTDPAAWAVHGDNRLFGRPSTGDPEPDVGEPGLADGGPGESDGEPAGPREWREPLP